LKEILKVPLASSGLRPQDIDTVVRVLESGFLTMGKEVKEFEHRMKTYLGVRNFVMVNSGSSANLLMVESLLRPTNSRPRLSSGDGILVPAIAWPTTVWPLIQLGLNPIFVDVDENSLALDLQAAQRLLDTSNIPVKGILIIHPLGYAVSHAELSAFVERNDLISLSDVCESLGSWTEGRHAGVSSLASSFSFYFSHHITTMEGGGIATDDDELADDLRSMRSHGWSRDRSDAEEWESSSSSNDSKFLFVSTGYNVRPMEIQAAVGSSQLADLDKFVLRRREIARKVHESLRGTDMAVIGSERLESKELEQGHSWMLVPIRISAPNFRERRNEVLDYLNSSGVETRPVLTGNFLAQPAVQRIFRQSVNPDSYTQASLTAQSSFLVGAHHELSDEQVDYLCRSLKEAGARSA
jgi:CDP-6-deoxy-D-xylo-4-hexulose-3-dehydrase